MLLFCISPSISALIFGEGELGKFAEGDILIFFYKLNFSHMRNHLLLCTLISLLSITCKDQQQKPEETKPQDRTAELRSLYYNQTPCWSIAGCLGVTEDQHQGKLALGGLEQPISSLPGVPSSPNTSILYEDMSVSIKKNAMPGKYIIRYPITNTGGCYMLKVHYKLSDKLKDKVTIHLKEWDHKTSYVKILETISSAETDETGKYISKESFVDLSPWLNVYYVEAILETTRKSDSGTQSELFRLIGPALGSVELCSTTCPVSIK
jgi:hypothetical protein